MDPAAAKGRFLTTSGVVDPSTDLYIERATDQELHDRLLGGRSAVLVGSRCMGKTSMANYVGQWLEHGARPDALPEELEAGAAAQDVRHFRMAIIDFDGAEIANLDGSSTVQRTDRLIRHLWENLDLRGHDAGERPAPGSTLREGLVAMAKVDPERPLLVVMDEFDRLARIGEQGGEIVHAIRGILQELAREPKLRSMLVLCMLSVRGAPELFQDLVDDPGAGLELPALHLPLGPFAITDRTSASLAEAFRHQDSANADNLARKVLEVSGGYPQLCLELALRTLEEHAAYGPDYERFLFDQVRWMQTQADPIRRRFFQIFEGFIAEDPRLGEEALWVYRQVLVANRSESTEVGYRSDDPAQRLLVVSGLARISGDRLRTYSPFLERYFDLEWADRVREELHQRVRTEASAAAASALESGEVSKQRPARARISDRRIAVLVTGGTIGMIERDGRVRPPATPGELADEYREVNELFQVDWDPIANLDSSEVGPAQWSEWARVIARRVEDFDGIVVAHGTDTLAFTASAVAYALGDKLDIPVVFTGSQTTVDAVYGDARTNLLRACMVAAAPRVPSDLPEVVVSFGENVFRAVRAVKRDDRRFDAFESPAYPALGMINEDVTLYEHLIRQPERLVPGVRMPLDLKPDFESGILVLPQIPGVLPTYYRAALHQAGDAAGQAPRGIVIQSLGAGNIPTEGDQSLVPFIYEACEMGIPVLLASQYPIYPANLGKYRPPRRAIAAGAIPVVNMTTAALIAKLSWVIARVGDSSGDRLTELVRAYMLNNLVGEIDDQDLAVLGQLDVANIRLSVAEEADAGSPDPLGHGITD